MTRTLSISFSEISGLSRPWQLIWILRYCPNLEKHIEYPLKRSLDISEDSDVALYDCGLRKEVLEQSEPSDCQGFNRQKAFQGAGHFVPTDRPAQALQMITNFLKNSANYSTPVEFDLTPKPLLPQYANNNTATQCSRKVWRYRIRSAEFRSSCYRTRFQFWRQLPTILGLPKGLEY